VVLALAIMLGDTVRSRRALAAETADRLRLAAEERETETARRLAEERLRIARELHDTVAHSMATITVQAGSALHLPASAHSPAVQAALTAIRETSKSALADMRVTLGQLRGSGASADPARIGPAEVAAAGLDRLPALSEAVRAAGAPVTVTIEGEQVPLEPGVDHAAYRILQESLTNVLRHAGPQASAVVRLSYGPGTLTIEVTDDGTGPDSTAPGSTAPGSTAPGSTAPGSTAPAGPEASGAPEAAGGHGLTGMAERAAAVGGQLTAGPRPAGGFGVLACLPLNAMVRQP